MSHTKEPWRLGRFTGPASYEEVRETCGRMDVVADTETGPYVLAACNINFPDDAKANASRIVACVNACAGIPTESLEAGMFDDQSVRSTIAELESANKGLYDGTMRQASRIAELEAKVRELEAEKQEQAIDHLNSLGVIDIRNKELTLSRQQVERLVEALKRAERKLSAYVGVCTGDKELTDTVLPLAREALAAVEKERHNGGSDPRR